MKYGNGGGGATSQSPPSIRSKHGAVIHSKKTSYPKSNPKKSNQYTMYQPTHLPMT